MNAIQHFILVFDRAQGVLVREERFGSDSDAAVARYAELEKQHRDNKEMDIVLIGSDSIETVKVTHANYFDGTVAISEYLAGV